MKKYKQFDLLVYIGRFQPFHKGHYETVNKAVHLAENVLVLIGSPNRPRDIRHPFTYDERVDMIKESIKALHLYIDYIDDFTYNNPAWIEELGQIVNKYAEETHSEKIGVIGFEKDLTSSYLNFFPQWHRVQMQPVPADGQTIDATKIRELLFSGNSSFIWSTLPSGTADFIEDILLNKPDWYNDLVSEYYINKTYKDDWAGTPYPVVFSTVDAVVVQSGHILLVERGEYPGKGLLAMPGGFLNIDETLEKSMLRELREETKLKVPEKVLKGSIVHKDTFDDPNRSTRGRTITTAFLIHLNDAEELPKVRGGDDAKKAEWHPLCDLEMLEDQMYEDHYHIIRKMLAKLD